MQADVNQPRTHLTAPDDSSKLVRKAIPAAPQATVVFPGPFDSQAGSPDTARKTARRRAALYGMPLAWRGLRLLGVDIGIAAVWFVTVWIQNRRIPFDLTVPTVKMHPGNPPALNPILPPTWLLALLGLLAFIALGMMLVGTQNANPKMKDTKAPNQAATTHGDSSAHQG